MNSDVFDASTRFFKSFAAGDLPLHPVDEVDFESIDNLASFYAATYDETGRLVQFRKFSNVEAAGGHERQLVFTESYEYYGNGEMRCRTLIRSDGSKCQWVFEENATACKKLFSCHERLTKMEDAVLCDLRASSLRGRELSRAMWEEFHHDATQVLRDAANDPELASELFLLDKKDKWYPSEPVDWPNIPLGFWSKVIEVVAASRDGLLLIPSSQALSSRYLGDTKEFEECQIRAIAIARIRASIERHDETVALLAVLARREWDAGKQWCIEAILRRIASFLEVLLVVGGREDSMEEDTGLPEPDTGEQAGNDEKG